MPDRAPGVSGAWHQTHALVADLAVPLRQAGTLENGSDLLFVAVLNTLLVKYSGVLGWMYAPRPGLSEPTTLVLDLSLPGPDRGRGPFR
ncbi:MULTISPECIES: hypothetical protein [unclassified Cyanobium]|uniref:hypothetical protein n=1 Tax=unclassified Cyanobium TaxID=2627006 RepID=UPI0020CEE127|nr:MULTISPECIES: hypothetical protein [unclassified Cyanobium]MCP9835275.1 hypothetical protein [Cyanobium sp. La Preciosa 7G6]MCP9938041.1 hypothetical protein [Cyanobium sp. Aljojuca 7A6]